MKKIVLHGALACIFSSGLTHAQDIQEHFFGDSRLIVGDWTFVPIYSLNESFSVVVNGLFVYADEASRTGENLSAVWYSRSAGEWSASSWQTTDLEEAIKSITIAANIQNGLWEYFFNGPFTGTPESPKPFSSGVLEGDPVDPVVSGQPDPQPILEFLVSVGYAAANVPVIGDAGCDQVALLDDLALSLQNDVANGDDTVASIPTELCAGPPRGPRPVRPPKPATAPPWTDISLYGPLPGPGWVPGGWPTRGTPPVADWWCFRTAGGNSCFCSRVQQWGRWETKNGSVRWHVVYETESCNANEAATCPAGGPPPANATCSSRYED